MSLQISYMYLQGDFWLSLSKIGPRRKKILCEQFLEIWNDLDLENQF